MTRRSQARWSGVPGCVAHKPPCGASRVSQGLLAGRADVQARRFCRPLLGHPGASHPPGAPMPGPPQAMYPLQLQWVSASPPRPGPSCGPTRPARLDASTPASGVPSRRRHHLWGRNPTPPPPRRARAPRVVITIGQFSAAPISKMVPGRLAHSCLQPLTI